MKKEAKTFAPLGSALGGAISRRGVCLGGAAFLAAAPGGAVQVQVSGGRCLVPVSLDGRAARLLLDTGAERSVLVRSAAARLKLPFDRWVATTLRGSGGLLERQANVDVASISAGGIALYQRVPGQGASLPVTTADLDGADGLLGGDLLRHFVLDLDIGAGRLALRAAGPHAPAPGAVALQTWRQNLVLATVRLDGHALVALLDTGSAASLINARGLYRLGLHPGWAIEDREVRMQSVGGVSLTRAHRFGALRVGGLSVKQPVFLAQEVPEAAFDLTLGMDVLGRQRMVLSYPGLTIAFPEA